MEVFMSLKKLSLFLLSLLLLPACMRREIRVATNSYADATFIPNGFVKGKSFAVSGGSYVDGIEQKNEMQTKELTKKVSLVLDSEGYSVKQNLNQADYCIIFNYGSKSETKILNMPIYIPGQTTTSTGTVSGVRGYYGQYQQESATSGTYIYMPEEYTFYTKFLCFSVYDAKQCQSSRGGEKMPPQIWYGQVWNVNEQSDLRSYLDFLLIQLFKSFGKDSQGTITSSIYEDDESVAWLRHSYFNPDSSTNTL
jgi:hypothetical protein